MTYMLLQYPDASLEMPSLVRAIHDKNILSWYIFLMESCDLYYESRFSVLTNCLMCKRSKFLKIKLKMHDGNELRTIRSSENFCFKHILFTTK